MGAFCRRSALRRSLFPGELALPECPLHARQPCPSALMGHGFPSIAFGGYLWDGSPHTLKHWRPRLGEVPQVPINRWETRLRAAGKSTGRGMRQWGKGSPHHPPLPPACSVEICGRMSFHVSPAVELCFPFFLAQRVHAGPRRASGVRAPCLQALGPGVLPLGCHQRACKPGLAGSVFLPGSPGRWCAAGWGMRSGDPTVTQGLSPVPASLMAFLPGTQEETFRGVTTPKSWGWVQPGFGVGCWLPMSAPCPPPLLPF